MTAYDALSYWLNVESRPQCFVYVIQAEGDQPVKVGKAVDVMNRIGELQTGNPRPLRLLAVMPGSFELEWQLHYRMRQDRMVGEWFGGERLPDFVAFAQRLMCRMVDDFKASGVLLDFKTFEDGWAFRRLRGTPSPAVVTYVDPDPEAVAQAEKLRAGSSTPFVASGRQKREFAQAHGHPTFAPHKRP